MKEFTLWNKNEITEFIRQEFRQTGLKRAVIGLSGGIDSTVVAYLAAEALGPKKVLGISLPYNSKNHDAKKIAKNLEISFQEVDIKPIVKVYGKMWGNFDKEENKVIKGNLMARIRMTILYATANTHSSMVLGTTNKSEWEIGYFTKWGDGVADIEPIKHLYKTDVFALAKLLDVPDNIIYKTPSADLWDNQTDEGEIGFSYERLDLILKIINGDYTKSQIIELVGEYDYNKVLQMMKSAGHKRHIPSVGD